MKKFLSTILIMLLMLCAFSQTSHMTFKGIEIDGTLTEFTSKLAKEGFVMNYKSEEGCIMKGKFAGENAEVIIPCSPGEKVWKVAVIFDKCYSWYNLKTTYFKYKESLTQKYGDGVSYEFFKEPYYEGDGYELSAVRMEKCTYFTSFETENGYLSINIAKDQTICISYEDKTNTEINDNKKEQQKIDDL